MEVSWPQFQSTLRNYQETTDGRNRSFEVLHTKDEKSTKVSDIEVGDRVILGQSKRNKLTTRFEKEPCDVVDRDGNAVVIQRGEEPRNIAHMKKLNGCPETS